MAGKVGTNRRYHELHDPDALTAMATTMSNAEMAASIGCTAETVRKALDRWVISRRELLPLPAGYLSARGAARLLGRSHNTVLYWLKTGYLPADRPASVGSRGMWRIPESAVQRLKTAQGRAQGENGLPHVLRAGGGAVAQS